MTRSPSPTASSIVSASSAASVRSASTLASSTASTGKRRGRPPKAKIVSPQENHDKPESFATVTRTYSLRSKGI